MQNIVPKGFIQKVRGRIKFVLENQTNDSILLDVSYIK